MATALPYVSAAVGLGSLFGGGGNSSPSVSYSTPTTSWQSAPWTNPQSVSNIYSQMMMSRLPYYYMGGIPSLFGGTPNIPTSNMSGAFPYFIQPGNSSSYTLSDAQLQQLRSRLGSVPGPFGHPPSWASDLMNNPVSSWFT